MEVLTQPTKKEIDYYETPPPQRKNYWWLVIIALILVFAASKFEDFVIQKDDGTYEIAPKRLEDLDRRLDKIDDAEQYALVATSNGWYPCFNCGTSMKIYLYIGEVWKYGVSKNGSQRYKKHWYRSQRLQYIPEFRGTMTDCMKMELTQIYAYPLLPENIKRDEKLPRPPGNKVDN